MTHGISIISSKISIAYVMKCWLLITLICFGCTNNFDNQDPNNPIAIPTAYLMTGAQRTLLNPQYIVMGMLYTQQWSQTLYTESSRYNSKEASFEEYYIGPLINLQQIIELNANETTKDAAASSGSNENQIAICRILKALIFQWITDIWGDIPYSESLLGRDNFSPRYDSQESIYEDLVKELTEAALQIDLNAPGMEGDIIYGGDMEAWRLFANSLKMRIGIRMTEVNPTRAREVIESACQNGVFSSNSDNALYPHLDDANNYNPFYAFYLTMTDFAISNILVDFMSPLNDPRLPVYADPASATNTIVGMPYGISNESASNIPIEAVSLPGQSVRQADTKEIIMTYSEVLFIMAEAAQRGWEIGGEAADVLYEHAITASMEYWGIGQEDIITYLNNPSVSYNPDEYKKSIGEQKWISLYMNGLESWSEWRRLDYPDLEPAPDSYMGRDIPRRRAYSKSEYDLNGENVLEAVIRQGPDEMETRIWWDR